MSSPLRPIIPSLPEVHASVPVNSGKFVKRMISFFGPGYLVAVGYMDPGNWATSLAGGSAFGYTLLSVALMSNIMAILLQALSLRLGIASGHDLAQACRDAFPRWFNIPMWLLAEAAIVATDLAEVIGTAIGFNLLFGIPMEIGVVLTALDVFLILWLQNRGFRLLEALVIALTLVIFACFAVDMAYAQPVIGDVLEGFIPRTEIVTSPAMLYLALGIIGATVMPHNLYLHSAIIKTRNYGHTIPEKRDAIRLGTIDSTVALMFALLINAAILILAAAAFHTVGRTDVAEIQDAYALLGPLLGAPLAATVFAVALLASGLNSTVTATLSGQIVMEGFVQLRMKPWQRRLLTRSIAIVPAVFTTILYGESGTADLLVLSQVVLSLQLPFAIVPLVIFTADNARMQGLRAPRWMTWSAWIIAAIVITLNLKLIWDVSMGNVAL
ncbi:Nramp family divalent metal transporter [Aquicoccus sp. G2-2]|uniref:Nramp family divalent metal transporter n=1 Tax=Aquicoccus sp. G2-2 TaxID=3092120 RepID=UPI002ADFE047|nr:Nramp family divalent metal transporter [Aquicoccus sp. G2-2]MEA1113835.1 Nramp family divalent metal transporter [Aquicoccus sp. G2-2]